MLKSMKNKTSVKTIFFSFSKHSSIIQFIDQVQNDLTERSTLHVSINNQLAQENKVRMIKITELEQALSQEQQRVCFFTKGKKADP
jgi:hypothetical protein